jgi:hypothetical protein
MTDERWHGFPYSEVVGVVGEKGFGEVGCQPTTSLLSNKGIEMRGSDTERGR